MSFTKLFSFNVEYAPQYTITKYISSRTRMQLVHINSTASPLVEGYFAVPTEITNDSGCPHTLEHLVFMGSKKYPFKSTLDIAGNICMSTTNAWTATDQTVYTLSTAGWTGFKKLLPVYLDHLINPVLTDEACTTEVYHIDPETFQDKGVVYSEMEGIESQSWFITSLEMQRLLFDKDSGYKSETGGLTANLRNLTNDEIRQFHKDMYSPDNMCLIITGNVPEDELLQIVEDFDGSLNAVTEKRVRPFVETATAKTLVPHFHQDIVESTVRFPEMDETQGEMRFSWIASLYTEGVSDLALACLLEYLTKGPLATFQKELVEIEDPLANFSEYDTDDYYRSILNLNFYGVPTEKLQEAKNAVLNILSTHKVDIERMKQVVDSYKLDYIIKCENKGADLLSAACITDFLYEKDEYGATLKQSVSNLKDFDTIYNYSTEMWQSVLDKWLVQNKPTIVIAEPSAEVYEQLNKEKEERLAKRKTEYGEEGSKKLKAVLDNANARNNTPIPENVLEEFVLDDPASSVKFIETTSISSVAAHNDENNELVKQVLANKPADLPMFIHVEHFPTQFVEIHACLNSKFIKDVELLPYYLLFCDLFTMPMKLPDGSIMPYEDVVACIKKETLDSDVLIGIAGNFQDFVNARLRAKAENYEHSVGWIKHVLQDMVFDEKRVTVLLENFLSSIVETKRSGSSMLYSLVKEHLFEARSLSKSTDVLFVEELLKEVLEQIKAGDYKTKVFPKIETFRSDLRAHLSESHIVVLGNVEKLGVTEIYAPWVKHFGNGSVNKIPEIPKACDNLSVLGKTTGHKKAFIITTPASESSFMSIHTPLSINYDHEDFPALLLAAEFLQGAEGPFWKGIRGLGLAYGAYTSVNDQEKQLSFEIYRGADIIKCYETGKQIIADFASGKSKIDSLVLKGALSLRINRIVQQEDSYVRSALRKYVSVFGKKLPLNYNEEIFKKMAQVNEAKLIAVIGKYFVPLFEVTTATPFIACHPSNCELITEFFEKMGYVVSVKELHQDENSDSDEETDYSDSEEDD